MRVETRHSIVLTAGTGITAALGLIYVVFVQRTLGRDVSADFVAALSFIAFCQIALGPINGTVARFTAQFAHRNEVGKMRTLCRTVAARVALLGLLGLAVGLIALKALTGIWHFGSPLSLLTAYAIVYVTLILSVARGVLRGVQAFGQVNLNTILEAAIRLCLGVWLLQTVHSSEAGLAAYLGALIVILAVSHVQLRSIWRGSPRAPIDGGQVKRFTGRMFVLMLTSAAFQNVDMLTVKHCFAASEAGLYGAAFTLARSMGALATPFTTLLLPLLATMHENGQRSAGVFLRVSSYFLALAVLPVALFGLWPDRVIGLVYTDDFAAAGDVLLAVTVARLLGYLCHLLALVGAATDDFGMLRVYVPGLLLQSIALAAWHDTSEQVANVMIVGQAVTLAALGAYYLIRRPTAEIRT